jgi:hypothetical protein
MDIFLTNEKYKNGDIITKVIEYLHNKYAYQEILLVRTPTTGAWLDSLFLNTNANIVRLLYETDIKETYTCHETTIKLKHHEIDNQLKTFNKKYDLICIDSCHLYTNSKMDLEIMSSYLANDGIMICHDCFPSNKKMARPIYTKGRWSGETYIAFIEFAYNHPNYYYGLINIDIGIGILSKKYIDGLKNTFDKEKQRIFLSHKNNEPYDYFIMNYNDLMNVIQ